MAYQSRTWVYSKLDDFTKVKKLSVGKLFDQFDWIQTSQILQLVLTWR